ncbi:hypothetical protein GCM10009718_28070 [Isoptericola halotolerans]|uniref:Integral membrane protein n=1 Tax=Isoptericola halotolerans TaxID=300560 RepID=A0ABX2A3E8_9MICO|nr:hypothetical protein [Isoptericola halotolerans]NOV97343.1 hypothetical protein [Isoptericola halotolerans]
MAKEDDAPVEDASRRAAELERENAELRRLLAAQAPPDEPRESARRRPGRSAAAVALIVAATLLAPAAVIAAWAERTLTDTDRYVSTVAPLADDPVVQSAVAGRITQELMTRLDVATLVHEAVGELQGTLDDREIAPRATAALSALEAPLTNGVESFVRETADHLVTSPQFATLWAEANRTAHRQLVVVMQGADGELLQVQDGQLTIQLAEVIDVLKERLAERGLDAARSIPSIDASFTLARSTQLVDLQNRYGQLVALGTWLPWVTLGLYAAAALVAVRPLRALLGAGLALAVAMVLLGAGLAVSRELYLDALTGRVLRLDAAEAVFDQTVSFLRITLRTVGVLGIVVAVAAYLAGASDSARTVRRTIARSFGRLRTRAERRGVTTGRLGTWLGRHGRAARGAVLACGALVLLLAPQLTPQLVVGAALVTGAVVAVLELLARPARGGDGAVDPPGRDGAHDADARTA